MKCSTDICESIMNAPPGASYWIKRRRKVIYEIFKDEICKRKIRISSKKVTKAITKLGEKQVPQNEKRIRRFVHRLRNEYFQNIEAGSRSLGKENKRGAGRCRYWTKEKRKIIREVFKDELLDRSLQISRPKIIEAITKLEEERNYKTEHKIRTFVHRLRGEEKRKMKATTFKSGRCRYWIEERRKIIRDVFKDEILDRSLHISRPKIIKAIIELEEEQNYKTERKIRTFLHRLREEEKQKMKPRTFQSVFVESLQQNVMNLEHIKKEEPESDEEQSGPTVVFVESFQQNVMNLEHIKKEEPESDEEQSEPTVDLQSFDENSSDWTSQITDDNVLP